MALGQLGSYRVEALTEATPQALACKLYYAHARDSVLRGYPWSFATARRTLALLTSEEDEKWEYVYGYPVDCLQALYIVNVYGTEKLEFEVGYSSTAGTRVIYTDTEEAILVYSARVEDPNNFDPLFVESLYLYLATLLAHPLRADMALKREIFQHYAQAIQAAQARDAAEGSVKFPTDSTLKSVRA